MTAGGPGGHPSAAGPSSPAPPGDPAPREVPPGVEVRERAGCRTTLQVLPSGVVRVTAPPGTDVPDGAPVVSVADDGAGAPVGAVVAGDEHDVVAPAQPKPE